MEPHDVKLSMKTSPGYHPGGKNIQQIKRHEAQIPIPRPKAGYYETPDPNFQKLDQRTPYRIYFNILFQNVKHKCTNLFVA